MAAEQVEIAVGEVVEHLQHAATGVREPRAVAGSRWAETQHSWLAALATASAIGLTIMELPK